MMGPFGKGSGGKKGSLRSLKVTGSLMRLHWMVQIR